MHGFAAEIILRKPLVHVCYEFQGHILNDAGIFIVTHEFCGLHGPRARFAVHCSLRRVGAHGSTDRGYSPCHIGNVVLVVAARGFPGKAYSEIASRRIRLYFGRRYVCRQEPQYHLRATRPKTGYNHREQLRPGDRPRKRQQCHTACGRYPWMCGCGSLSLRSNMFSSREAR